MFSTSPEFYWIAVALITVISTARITRLLTFDHLPPVERARYAIVEWTEKRKSTTGYGLLVICGYCMSFWVALVIIAWADITGVLDGAPVWGHTDDTLNRPAWFMVNGTFAAAYLAAVFMARDGDDS